MKVLILTTIAIVMIVGSVYAQIDSVDVTMANILDKTVDRLCEGLGQFADQSGRGIETAWPYAVKYVGAKYKIQFWGFIWVPAIFLICLIGLFVALPKSEWDYDMNGWGKIALVFIILGVCSTIGTVAWLSEVGFKYYLFLHAPEAVTVEYLMGLL